MLYSFHTSPDAGMEAFFTKDGMLTIVVVIRGMMQVCTFRVEALRPDILRSSFTKLFILCAFNLKCLRKAGSFW